ncbi:MAG TPA: hypothetical protein VE197_04625, partial [Mycobacterium sp.]|nr:hypothetical protein [Mycobacterium sp.]
VCADVASIECTAPREVTHRRIVQRRTGRTSGSDATPAVADAMAMDRDPWGDATVIDTTRSESEVLQAALEAVLD